ncbi:uncharacterized protein LOC124274775 [Haliotis rubra]|uniref:uncharacterized protein LOC124274775 n=1 Tax=Haliotis rubra TaxID=36100 RepID=UPI001EE51DE1|nr:uncharacterized protein LOC124274775 [Haliotis rubra]
MYGDNKELLISRLSNNITNRRKQDVWKKITNLINSRSSGITRDLDEVKKKWKDLLRKAKKDIAAHKNPTTGGGPQHKDSAYTSWVLDIIGTESSSLVGIEEGVESGHTVSAPFSQISRASSDFPEPSTSSVLQSSATTVGTSATTVGTSTTTVTAPQCPDTTPQSSEYDKSAPRLTKRKATDDDLYQQLLAQEIERAKAQTERAHVGTERARAETIKIQVEIKLLERRLEQPDIYTLPILPEC